MLLGFQKRFEPMVLDGSKTHTIRADSKASRKAGMRCDCYGDSCKFCDQPAVACCEWPIEGFKVVHYYELKIGDRVRRAIDRLQRRPPATVTHVAEFFRTNTDAYASDLQICLRIRGKDKEIIVKKLSLVQVAKEVPCLMPVCEDHLRCVEPGVEYCMDHWNAWSAVA